MDNVSPSAMLKVFETVRSDVWSVIVPAELGLMVRLYNVCPPPVIEFDVPVMVMPLVPALTVSVGVEDMIKFPVRVAFLPRVYVLSPEAG
jgi:hypothetical protein